MFDRFLRLAKARQALAEERLEAAWQLADDPWIREDRRAAEVRMAARAALLQRIDARLAAGDVEGAERALVRVVRAHPDPVLESQLVAVRAQRANAHAAAKQVEAELRAVAEQMARGAVREAEEALAACAVAGGAPAAAAVAAVRRKLAEQQAAAVRALAAAQASVAEQDPRAALAALSHAQALDAALARSPAAAAVLLAGAEWLRAQVATRLAADGAGAAVAFVREQVLAVPQLAALPPAAEAVAEVVRLVRARLQAAAQPEHELELLHAGVAAASLPGGCAELGRVCTALLSVVALRAHGGSEALRDALQQAAKIGSPRLAAEAAALTALWVAANERVRAAREQALLGHLDEARQAVVAVLHDLPAHADARAALDAIERSLRERDAQVQNARAAASAGRLREALALALAQVGNSGAGRAARDLAMELSARLDRVQHGVDQVRAMLHGPGAASVVGLQQCIAQIDELARVQTDHEELPRLRAGLLGEVRALEQCLAAHEELPHKPAAAASALVALIEARAQFCRPDRLDAKLLGLADALAASAEALLQRGQLAAAAPMLAALQAAVVLRADLGGVVERLAQRVREREARAKSLVEAARVALRSRDLARATEHAEQAAALWADHASVQAVRAELRSVSAQASSLDRIAALTEDGELADAQHELDELAPAQPLLRTRIFDMKQSLAKAQGFDAAFLLRVDEGGEHLVLRSESLVIGNVRDGSADLPVLAAIAGRHARIERSMSFHGGMTDTVLAEAGEVKVDGHSVARHALRHGDRLQLGALALRYSVPSARSLTAALGLLGGFQAAGTDRVLLLKDRGRDGRILIGKGSDVHVSVPHATAEVEVFAHKTGQLRVRCEQGGTIDGKPFGDEHPVDPGALVQAGGVTFVLLPWAARR